jgi:hypothetical protein
MTSRPPLEERGEESTMTTRMIGSAVTLAACIAVGALMSVPVAGQATQTTQAAPASPAPPPLVVTAFGGAPVTYKAPRTPWGDPDLQGVWASDDMAGIPMSRPAQYGDRLFLNEQELAARKKQIDSGVARSENEADSTFRFDFARRAFPQTSQVVDPPNGQMPATLPGRRQMPRGTFGPGPLDWVTDFSGYERCITRGIFGSALNVIYGNGNRIVQSPGAVAFSYEMLSDTRIFYTDGRPRISSNIKMYLGDSRARWEGEDLVVETTNLTDRTAFGVNGNGPLHSEKMKVTERFRRVAADILQYQITVDDPETYVRPFTVSMPLTPLEGGKLLPYDCHPGNYAILQSLGAERVEDKRLADDLERGIIRPRIGVQEGAGVGAAPAGGGGGRGRGAGPAF